MSEVAERKPLKAASRNTASPSPVRINSYGAKEAAVEKIGAFEENGDWWVHFRKSGENRSQKQRRLMAMWAEEWAAWLKHYKGDAFTHVTPDKAYNSFKLRIALPKLVAVDTTGVYQYLEQRVVELSTEQAKLEFVGRWIHTDDLSTDEYAKCMEQWEGWTRDEEQSDGQFQPSHPEDLYYSAMGKR